MADYYVFSDAAGGGSGSEASPWNAFSSLPSLSAGDRVIHRGDFTMAAGTNGISVAQSGSAGSFIRFVPYNRPNGRTVLRCADVQRGVNVGTDVHHIVIEGFRITGVAGGSGVSRYGVINNVTGASPTFDASIHVIDCEIDTVTTSGAFDCNGIFLTGKNNKVLKCEVHDIATDGIWYRGHDFEAGWNRVYSISQDGRSAGDCIQCGATADRGWIHDNYLDHSDVDSKQCYIHNTASTGLIFEGNECIGYGSASFTTVLLSAITGAIARRNILRGGANCHLSLSCQDGLAEANLIVNNYGRGIDLGAVNADAYCNTIVWAGYAAAGSGVYGIRHNNSANTGVNAQNNLLHGAWDRGISGTTGSSASYNAFWGCTTNVGGIASGGNDLTTDPTLTGEWKPRQGSPVLNSGADLGPVRDNAGRMGRGYIGAYTAAYLVTR